MKDALNYAWLGADIKAKNNMLESPKRLKEVRCAAIEVSAVRSGVLNVSLPPPPPTSSSIRWKRLAHLVSRMDKAGMQLPCRYAVV